MKTSTTVLITALGLAGALAASGANAAPNWAASPAKPVALFYPGQSSWEWALTTADHPGADKFKGGKNCFQCHDGDEKNMGALMASGKKNEPSPIPGKPGSLDAKVQFSHDADTLYVRLTFAEGAQPNAHQDPTYATKVTMILNGGGVPEANRAGCWGSCHDDSAGMASAGGSARTMYLGKTRAALSRSGGGDALKPAAALDQLKGSGYQLEYWQAHLNPGAAAVASNGVIFDKRTETKPTLVSAQASNAGGTWTVVLSRKLNAPGAIPLVAGRHYTVGFAIHSGHAAKRFHYVSFERSLVLDQGAADFVAK